MAVFKFKKETMQDDRVRNDAIAEAMAICTDALSARMPNFTETRLNIMGLLNDDTAEKSGFFERETQFCVGKTEAERINIICSNLATKQDDVSTYELAQHCYDWFDGHSTFKKNVEFELFCNPSYSLENFVAFVKTLTYRQLSRWLEEAIADNCNQELILSLMQ